MTSAPKLLPRMTVAEFLEWDSTGYIGKLELVEGEVRAMAPASGAHAIIQANIAGLLWSHLRSRKSPCRVGTEAPVVPRIFSNANVRVPDIAVTCQPPTEASERFPDPVLIVEVLSPSNQRETWESIRAVGSVPAMMEILVIDSERVHGIILRREADGGWPVTGTDIAPGGTVQLTSIGSECPLADMYAGTLLAGGPR